MPENKIGPKIQQFRKAQHMTQDELSKVSGIYLSTIKKYESGERNPKPDQLLKIADALGVSINVFLDYDINTVSDVISLIMKLDEQTDMRIQADRDVDENIISSSITLSFADENINNAIASYIEYKEKPDTTVSDKEKSIMIGETSASNDDAKCRLLLYNQSIKKSAK